MTKLKNQSELTMIADLGGTKLGGLMGVEREVLVRLAFTRN
jgi:hypothetical protein